MGIVASSSSGPDDDVASPRAGLHVGVGGVGTFGNNAEAFTSVPDANSPTDDFFNSQTVETATAKNIYVLEWNVTNGARVDNSTLFASVQRNAEITALKTRLEKVEREAAEVVALRGYVSELEAGTAVKSGEVDTLSKQNAELSGKVSAFEYERRELNRHIIKRLQNEVAGEAKLREEFKYFQDAAERHFAERADTLDAQIADVRRDMDNDLYPHMLTDIAGRRWVVRHGFRLVVYKCARSVECRSALGKIEAYDLEVEGKYVAAVFEFENVSFPLLDELEGLKDSPLALIMSALTLKDDHGNKDATPEFH
ncbi:hypothetical protein Tco_1065999 [Tanacetum coccineum]